VDGPRRATNEAVVRRLFDAFARKDGFGLRGVFADDAVWRVPGDSVMAGTYDGRDAIFRFLGRLPKETGGTYGSRLIDVLASDDRAAALYRATGERNGRTLDLDQLLLFRLEDGLIREVLALPCDPATFELFWESRVDAR
jgi:ketosteroid isomerase-like protein